MDDYFENLSKKLCCTCLCKDRNLFQLCRVPDGVNNLYWLLSYDPEAYREGFYKDTTNLFICWECRAIICRISRFRWQACAAQRQLTTIADGQTDMKSQDFCLSRLSKHHTANYHSIIISEDDDNFIDCGPATDIKAESDDDIPLSELHHNFDEEETTDKNETKVIGSKDQILSKKSSRKNGNFKKKTKIKNAKNETLFSTSVMSECELGESRESRKMESDFTDAAFKCEGCIESFKTQIELGIHLSDLHVEKDNHTQCDICLCYLEESLLNDHKASHYQTHKCHFCAHVAYSVTDIICHLNSEHSTKSLRGKVKRKKNQRNTGEISSKLEIKSKRNSSTDKRTPFGYMCAECNKSFENKNQRWKHVQRYHREGYKCSHCEKRFAFKNNLTRHEQLHTAPPAREQCQVCHKMVRVDLIKTHAQIHAHRDAYSCVQCDKRFVSRASYEHHLKYTQTHAATDILKYKCSNCGKGYRSKGELRDHVNYRHMGKTQHKCPVCSKPLATRRCVTRHERRAHRGHSERARHHICQLCGKPFRDKKGLREHELIHSGERPLSCELCGASFRQAASLYTHRKRVHNVLPLKNTVSLE